MISVSYVLCGPMLMHMTDWDVCVWEVGGCYLYGNGQRGPTEMLLHNIGNSLCCAEQISHLIRAEVAESLHRAYGAH